MSLVLPLHTEWNTCLSVLKIEVNFMLFIDMHTYITACTIYGENERYVQNVKYFNCIFLIRHFKIEDFLHFLTLAIYLHRFFYYFQLIEQDVLLIDNFRGTIKKIKKSRKFKAPLNYNFIISNKPMCFKSLLTLLCSSARYLLGLTKGKSMKCLQENSLWTRLWLTK